MKQPTKSKKTLMITSTTHAGACSPATRFRALLRHAPIVSNQA